MDMCAIHPSGMVSLKTISLSSGIQHMHQLTILLTVMYYRYAEESLRFYNNDHVRGTVGR